MLTHKLSDALYLPRTWNTLRSVYEDNTRVFLQPDPAEAYERRRHEARQQQSRASSQPHVEYWTIDIPEALRNVKRQYSGVFSYKKHDLTFFLQQL